MANFYLFWSRPFKKCLKKLWNLNKNCAAYLAENRARCTVPGAHQQILDALLPHKNPVIGASLFGSADVPCIVHGLDNVKLTLLAAALTKPPNLRLSSTSTPPSPAASRNFRRLSLGSCPRH
jgi:hypothetical protein